MIPEGGGEGAASGGTTDAKKTSEPRTRYFRRDPKKPVVVARVSIKQPNFKGDNEALNHGHITYDCSDSRQSDILMKTTKKIAGYVGSNFEFGSDVRLAIESLSLPIIVEPVDPVARAL
jgi:hypothetical protein